MVCLSYNTRSLSSLTVLISLSFLLVTDIPCRILFSVGGGGDGEGWGGEWWHFPFVIFLSLLDYQAIPLRACGGWYPTLRNDLQRLILIYQKVFLASYPVLGPVNHDEDRPLVSEGSLNFAFRSIRYLSFSNTDAQTPISCNSDGSPLVLRER